MASYIKFHDKWRFFVSVDGIRRSKIFEKKTDGQIWARKIERELKTHGFLQADMSLAQLLEEYCEKILQQKGPCLGDVKRLRALQKDTIIGDVPISDLTKGMLKEWIRSRVGKVSSHTHRPIKSSSVARSFTVIRAALARAVEWGYIVKSPADGVLVKIVEDHRERIATEDEIERLKAAALWNENEVPELKSQLVVAAFVFACFTGMRVGEIVQMERSWINECTIMIPREVTKTYHGRRIAVPVRAMKILQLLLKKNRKRVFGLENQAHDAIFRKIRAMAGLGPVYDTHGHLLKEGLNFHDSRATFCTWAASPGPDGAPRLDVLSLARQTGHRNLRSLMHYYRKSPEEMLNRLNS